MKIQQSMKILAAAIISIPTPGLANGMLENPASNEIQSGISVISGWHCTANEIEVFINGESIGSTSTGSIRNDATSVCGHDESGYALLYNYNLLEDGRHLLEAYADGILFEKRAFTTIRSGGVPFLEGKSTTVTVRNFPNFGNTTELKWSQAKQSFVVADRFTGNSEDSSGNVPPSGSTGLDLERLYDDVIEQVRTTLPTPSTMRILEGPGLMTIFPNFDSVRFDFEWLNRFGAITTSRASCIVSYEISPWKIDCSIIPLLQFPEDFE